jgi:hypothetical protein
MLDHSRKSLFLPLSLQQRQGLLLLFIIFFISNEMNDLMALHHFTLFTSVNELILNHDHKRDIILFFFFFFFYMSIQ